MSSETLRPSGSATPDAAASPTKLNAQPEVLSRLGAVEPDRLYSDVGLRLANNPRPGLREALAACRAADTLVVTGLHRFARSLPDAARDIVGELSIRQGRWASGGTVHDPADPVGRQPSIVSGLVSDFEAAVNTALNRGRTIDGRNLEGVKGSLNSASPPNSAAAKRPTSSWPGVQGRLSRVVSWSLRRGVEQSGSSSGS
ncbi:MAG: recombinase family protein [Acidimicrobiales bacterium]